MSQPRKRTQKREIEEIIEATYNKIMALPTTDEQNEAAKEMLLFGSGVKVGKVLALQERAC